MFKLRTVLLPLVLADKIHTLSAKIATDLTKTTHILLHQKLKSGLWKQNVTNSASDNIPAVPIYDSIGLWNW